MHCVIQMLQSEMGVPQHLSSDDHQFQQATQLVLPVNSKRTTEADRNVSHGLKLA